MDFRKFTEKVSLRVYRAVYKWYAHCRFFVFTSQTKGEKVKVTTLRRKGEFVVRFSADGKQGNGGIDKSAICRVRKDLATHYRTPEVFTRRKYVDVIVRSDDPTELDNVKSFVEHLLIPTLKHSKCCRCESKKLPHFCDKKQHR